MKNKKILILGIAMMLMAMVVGVAFAQSFPMRGMYVTNDTSFPYRYITINGDRDSDRREIQLMDSTGNQVLHTVVIKLNNPRNRYYPEDSIRSPIQEIESFSGESITIQLAGSRRSATFTRM